MSFASGADHQTIRAIAPKQKFNVKKYKQSHLDHMLQTLPVSSNSEVLIMFRGQNHIEIAVRGESTLLRYNKLLRLTFLHMYNDIPCSI